MRDAVWREVAEALADEAQRARRAAVEKLELAIRAREDAIARNDDTIKQLREAAKILKENRRLHNLLWAHGIED